MFALYIPDAHQQPDCGRTGRGPKDRRLTAPMVPLILRAQKLFTSVVAQIRPLSPHPSEETQVLEPGLYLVVLVEVDLDGQVFLLDPALQVADQDAVGHSRQGVDHQRLHQIGGTSDDQKDIVVLVLFLFILLALLVRPPGSLAEGRYLSAIPNDLQVRPTAPWESIVWIASRQPNLSLRIYSF